MSNNEAKFLLNAYRPNGRDAEDASFASALDQAKADPALAAWFAREQTHAAAVSAKLREIAPPPGLRDAILAGGRASAQRERPASRRVSGWWYVLGAAAAVAVLASVATFVRPLKAADERALTAFALNDVVHGTHGGHGDTLQALRTELGRGTVHLATELPVDFQALAASGCRTLRVAGHDVLEVCFERNGREFHCYIARAGDFRGHQDIGTQFVQQGALAAATWTRGAHRFVVVSGAGLDAVKQLL